MMTALFFSLTFAAHALISPTADVVKCPKEAGRPELQALGLYELERFDQSKPWPVSAQTPRSRVIELLLSRLAKVAPDLAGRLGKQASLFERELRPVPAMEDTWPYPRWVPEQCTHLPVMRPAADGIEHDAALFGQLPALDQAVLVLHILWSQEIGEERAKTISPSRLVRLLAAENPPDDILLRREVLRGLDYIEYPFENGDVAFIRGHDLTLRSHSPMSGLPACGYRLKAGGEYNRCREKNQNPLEVFGIRQKSILAVYYGQQAQFQIPATDLGFPAAVTEYGFARWRVGGYSPDASGTEVTLKFNTDRSFNFGGMSVVCAAGQPVVLSLPGEDLETFNFSLTRAKFKRCAHSELRLKFGVKDLLFTGSFGGRNNSYNSYPGPDEESLLVMINQNTSAGSLDFGQYKIALKSVGKIAVYANGGAILDLKGGDSGFKLPIAGTKCRFVAQYLISSSDGPRVKGAVDESCTFSTGGAKVIANGHAGFLNASTGTLLELSGSWAESIGVHALGMNLSVEQVKIFDGGKALGFKLSRSEFNNYGIDYYSEKEGRLINFKDRQGQTYPSFLCVNSKLRRFEESSGADCPASVEGKTR